MTTTPHTQGRLVVKGGFSIYTEDEGIPVADASIHSTHAKSEADTRRLAACWNACIDIPTEALEQVEGCDTMLSRFQARDAVELTLITERLKAIQERDAALAALRLYEAAHESLFTQCCSNPVTNAWGKEVNMAALNEAHQQAQRVLRDRVRQDIARGARQSNGKLPG